MAKLVQQSTSSDPLFFFLVLSSDHLSPATGKTPTVTISKNGAAFASPAGSVTEISGGWYQVAGNATDTGTLGDILLHATEASSDNCDMVVAQVVAFNPRNANLGLSNVSANVAQWNGSNVVAPNVAGIPLVDVKYTLGTLSVGAAGYVGIDWGQVTNKTTTNNLSGTTIATVTNQLTAAAIATGIWQDTTAGDFTVASSVGKSVMNGVALGTGLTVNALTTNNDKTGYALTSGERDSVADALLARNVAGGSSSGRLVKEALYFLRNKFTTVGGALTVYQTDDSTISWTATLTTDNTAQPIVTSDPA